MSLKNLNPLTEADIPQPIARDTETAAAVAAHAAALDPHPGYEFRSKASSKSIAGPLSFPANAWSSLGTFATFTAGVQGAPSAILVGLNFGFDTNFPWQQACCAALLGPVWWQPVTAGDPGTKVFLEFHNATGFFVNIRFGRFSQDLRELQILPESLITIPSVGRVDVSVKRLL